MPSICDSHPRLLDCMQRPRIRFCCRADLAAAAPGARIPYLVDPNSGVALADSQAIVRYLFYTYAGAHEAAHAGSSLER